MIAANSLALMMVLASTHSMEMWEFTAPWCGSCRQMEPAILELKQGGVEIRQISFDENRALAAQAQVESLPTFLVVSDGQILERREGRMTAEQLRQMWLRHQSQTPAALPAWPTVPVVRGQTENKQRRGLSRAWSALADRFPRDGCKQCSSTDACAPAASQPGVMPPRGLLAQSEGSPFPEPVLPALPTLDAVLDESNAPGSIAVEDFPLPTGDSLDLPAKKSRFQNAIDATVRLRVEDESGVSLGTGTIIDVHEEEVLVLTCGHIFRDSKGRGAIHCDLFVEEGASNIPGKLISYDLRRDVGLVSLRPGIKVQAIAVGGPGCTPRQSDAVFSVGCNRGDAPSLIQNEILAINRYHGPANVVVGGRPVNGRSGGGLFDAQGRLIGVCSAADQENDEGLYAALGPIRSELDAAGLSFIYRPSRTSIARVPREVQSDRDKPQFEDDSRTQPAVPDLPNPSKSREASPQGPSFESRVTVEPKPNNANTANPANDTEIICIVRSKGAGGRGQAYVLDQPSHQLLQQLSREMSQRGAHIPTQWHTPIRGNPSLPYLREGQTQ